MILPCSVNLYDADQDVYTHATLVDIRTDKKGKVCEVSLSANWMSAQMPHQTWVRLRWFWSKSDLLEKFSQHAVSL